MATGATRQNALRRYTARQPSAWLIRFRSFAIFFRHVSSVTWLLINTGREMGDQMLRGRFPFRLSIFFAQTDRAGVGSIPLIALVSFFIGLTMALLTGYQLATFGRNASSPRSWQSLLHENSDRS
jgi:ABC-type transporter Mla maintaining outer membrane lipid asymmetry permease subunit MlaE